MRNAICKTVAAAAALALAGQVLAGGFYLSLGNPDASPEARKLNAVLTIKATGCHDPGTAKLSAVAIGIVNGQRREIPLKVQPLSSPGMFALAQQWPKEGRWVIKLAARNGEQFTNSLVAAGPAGIDRFHDRANIREFTAAEVDAMLK
jgi:hypothetical protein